MIPEIEFRYSYTYDSIYRNSLDMKEFLKKMNKNYPSQKEIIDFIKEINGAWKKEGDKILNKISNVCGLKWKDNKIVCYVVGACRQMSDPLTIKLCRRIDHAIDILTHELIHNMQSYIGDKKWVKWLKYLNLKYPKESDVTKFHVFLNAVHKKIYLDLFDNKRLERDVENSNVSISYRRSWKIVEELGHENIIKKFKEISLR